MSNDLSYGHKKWSNSYHIKKPLDEGVVLGKYGKWLVRTKQRGLIVSIACYEKQEDAEAHYNRLLKQI